MKLDLYLAQTTELQKIASRLLEGLPTIEKWVFRVLLSVIAYFVVGKLIKKVCNFLKTALQTAGVAVYLFICKSCNVCGTFDDNWSTAWN